MDSERPASLGKGTDLESSVSTNVHSECVDLFEYIRITPVSNPIAMRRLKRPSSVGQPTKPSYLPCSVVVDTSTAVAAAGVLSTVFSAHVNPLRLLQIRT